MTRAEWVANLADWRSLSEDQQRARFADAAVPTGDGRVRVGLLCPCLNMGGAEAWQLLLARTVDPAVAEWVGCCVTGGERSIDPGMRDRTARFMPVTSGRDGARSLAARCDMVIEWAVDGVAEILEGLPRKPRVVAVCHSPLESPWGVNHNARASGIDRWVAVSELALPAIPESARTSLPTSVIWNAVDAERLEVRRSRDEMLRAWGVPAGSKVAGYLGRLSLEKDPHAMRRMIGHLPPEWHAVLVGAGAERVEPHERLHLVGNDPEAGDCLNAFDVLVVPSHYESFGLTVAEGLWLGKPTVTTETGLARIVPGLARTVPIDADGPTLARAVLAASADTVRTIAPEIRQRLSPERFGREWTSLIAGYRRSPGPHGVRSVRENLSRVRDCPSRGSVLPISRQPDGCSRCGELSECRRGRGEIPGRVTLRDCLDCVSADTVRT